MRLSLGANVQACLSLCNYNICNKYENIMHWPISFTAFLVLPFIHGVKCCTGNNVYILISWLLQKPADLDAYSFQKRSLHGLGIFIQNCTSIQEIDYYNKLSPLLE